MPTTDRLRSFAVAALLVAALPAQQPEPIDQDAIAFLRQQVEEKGHVLRFVKPIDKSSNKIIYGIMYPSHHESLRGCPYRSEDPAQRLHDLLTGIPHQINLIDRDL